MAPRSTALPSAQTESARDLRRAFFCEMCAKGYARITEFEAHENSYDHQHRKRLKEMKALTQNPTAAVRNNRDQKKRKEKEEMLSMNLQTSESTAGGGGGGGARPNNSVGFRDATQVKSNAEVSSDQPKGFPSEQGDREVSRVKEEQEPKIMRPPMWDELDDFYTLVDASALPAEMQDNEIQLPWARIYTDKDELDELRRAVYAEIDVLDGGAARKDLMRVWDELSEGSDLDELDSDMEV